jgi:hypothetical protein
MITELTFYEWLNMIYSYEVLIKRNAQFISI